MTNIKDMKALANKAAGLKKHTETKKIGEGFEYTPPPAGKSVGRFIEYIELGKHPQRAYKGKAKGDAGEVRIVFELLSPKNIKEIDLEDGTKKKIADKITLQVKEGEYDTSKFHRLFEAMRYGRTEVEHMAQMIGEAFIFTIVHNKSEKNGKTYANIDKDGAYMIEAPCINDPIAETSTPVKVPAALSDLTLFIWDLPNQATWDSLYIDGTKTKKDDKGVETEVSKNWIQNKIFTATNFGGSALEQLLQEGGVDLTELEGVEAEAPDEEVDLDNLEAAPVEEVAKPVAKKPAAPVDTKPTTKATATTATKVSPSAKTVTSGAKAVKAKPAAAEVEDPLVALGLA